MDDDTQPGRQRHVLFLALLLLVLGGFGCSENKNEEQAPADEAGTNAGDATCEGDTCEGATQSGETGDTARTESTEGEATGGTQVGAQPAGSKENCLNLIDDDGDGLVDCQDPLCFGKTACTEQECDDGLDNDFDGLPDCADSDCDFTEACNPENCASYYDCMVALGCDCTHGLDCPLQETEEYGQCQQKCFASPNCRNNCVAALSIETQENIASLQGCVVECFMGGKGWSDCLFGDCLEEFADCYLVGESTCEEFFFECIYGCGGNPNCSENCFGELSPQGYIDFISWNQCRLEKCDKDEDYNVDSQACSNLAGMYACIEVGGSCIPVQEGDDCGALADCVLHCESLSDGPCLAGCVEGVGIPEDRKPEVANLFDCVLNICGTGEAQLVPACVSDALDGACSELLTTCITGETVE